MDTFDMLEFSLTPLYLKKKIKKRLIRKSFKNGLFTKMYSFLDISKMVRPLQINLKWKIMDFNRHGRGLY